MAFRTHLETPQAAGSLLAAAVWSQPSWERSRNSVDQKAVLYSFQAIERGLLFGL